ncbi:MAG: DUF4157 domain-containing protein [Leptonema illini]|uniref:DUF4157 domain-containing protein n=1 Tax=Leptonema illini TaxID=183 RepID=A0A833LV06_9LEPT|nr:MAG: DUF4157 domain-containing protein [Leptonema illini]
MPGGLHVGYGMSQSEQEAMRWQAHFGSGQMGLFITPAMAAQYEYLTGASPYRKTSESDAQAAPNTSSTISRAPAVQPTAAEEGFPLDEAQSDKVDTALAETGQPMPEEQKAVYEAHTGHDFSSVRVHTGSAAEQAADSIGAKAFAKGSDIVFARDEYNPSTAEGRGLIGHELAHVAQDESGTGVHRAPKEGENKEERAVDRWQIAGQLIRSARDSILYAPDVLGEAWEYAKEHWFQVISVIVALFAVESVIGALTVVPEPTLLTKVVAGVLQVFLIGILGVFVAVEATSAWEEGAKWWSFAAKQSATPEDMKEASQAFCRMAGHILLAVLAAAGVRAKIKGFKLPKTKVWRFGKHHTEVQWKNKMSKRGWTIDQIAEALESKESYPAVNNLRPGNSATRYVHPETGRSIVIDEITREILQVGGDGYLW